jgi:hypothetical protein
MPIDPTELAPGAASVTTRSPRRRAVRAVVALLLLNALLSFSTWWPTPGIVPDHRIAPEFVWTWVLLLALVAWRGPPSPRVLVLLTAAYALLVLGRYADVTTPALFGRPINLYWDGLQLPRFLWVSVQKLAWWQSAGVVAALLVGVALLLALLRWALGVAARDAAPYALRRRWAWVVTAAAALLVTLNHAGVRATWPVVSKPVVPTYWRQAQVLANAFSTQRRADLLPAVTPVERALAQPRGVPLAGLAGRDLYLIMLESVGAVVYDDARARAALEPVRTRFAADVAASGRHVASAMFTSPTFAGGSDLAQLGLLAAMDLSDPMRHDVLLTTDRPTLISLFRREGYRSYGLYPALHWEWPEQAFYGWDVFIEGRHLGYRGPPLGYWKIPDQFTAARFDELHPRTPGTPPRLVFFPTITNHLPFSPRPPFQADWLRVLDAEPFDAADTARALAERTNWLDMFPGFLDLVGYTYRWLGAWLRQPEPREAVYLLIGDHQPAASIANVGASWDVPVHLVTRDAALLARFEALGFVAGMQPRRESLGPLHGLTEVMLRAFADTPPPTAAAGPLGAGR